MKHEYLTVFIIFTVIAFYITNQWFQPDCTFTTFEDVEGHFITALSYQDQLLKYGDIYPVSFEYHLCYYIFSYSPVSYLYPLIFRPFVNPRLAFLITYNLIFSLSGLCFYYLLRKNKGSVNGSFLFSLLFIFSGIMTLQFSTIGSYHSLAALPFLFMSMACLQQYLKTNKTKDAFKFILLAVIAMSTHFFVGITTFIFYTIFLLIKKEYRLLSFFFAGALITAFYYFPLLMYSFDLSNQTINESIINFKPDKLIQLLSFNIFPASDGKGSTLHHFYNGPYYLIALIIALKYLHKKGKLKLDLFNTYLITMVLILLAWSSITFLGDMVSHDRMSFFLQLSFILITAITFSKFDYKAEVFIMSVITYLLSIVGSYRKTYFAVYQNIRFVITIYPLIIAIVLGIHYFIINRKRSIKFTKLSTNRYYFLIALAVIFFQYTLFLVNAQSNMRPACIYLNTSKITDVNIIQLHDQLKLLQSITYYTGGQLINNFGHTTLLKKLPKLGDPEYLNFSIASKIDTYLILGNLSNEVINLRFVFDDYPLSIIRGNVVHRYNLTQTGPLSFKVELPPEYDAVIVRLFYNPWWRAYEGDHELSVNQSDWFTLVSGLEGSGEFTLVFDNTYFMLGRLISFIALLLLGLAYYSQRNK